MITSIISTFKEQARCHKVIKAFYYKRNYETGSGNDVHPLFWLEDPITGTNQGNVFIGSVNFSVLFIPKNEEDVSQLQSLAFSIGLNILERIKQDKNSPVHILPSWSYMTLRNYYDNNACGCRFSVEFNQLNMQNLCLINEQFDPEKYFDTASSFPQFSLHPSTATELFEGKLPVFDLQTIKR